MINILSLFDGCSWWQQAIDNYGIKNYNYFASEIDKYAIQVTQENFPNTIQIWDITRISYWDRVWWVWYLWWLKSYNWNYLTHIDLLLWWSPCQWFSFAWKQLNFEDERSKLFFEYVRILKEVKPKYFLLENVKMKKEYQDIISEHLFWIQPTILNSSLLTAQNRVRLYWVWELQEDWTYKQVNIEQPQDRGVFLKDILQYEVDEKYYLSNETYEKLKNFESNSRISDLDWKSYCLNTMQWWHRQPKILNRPHWYFKWSIHTEKCPTIRSQVEWNILKKEENRIRKLTPIECERLQWVKDNYTSCVSNSQRYKMLWNWWTIPIIEHILKHII